MSLSVLRKWTWLLLENLRSEKTPSAVAAGLPQSAQFRCSPTTAPSTLNVKSPGATRRWLPEFITNTWVGTLIVEDVVLEASVVMALLMVAVAPPPQPLAASAAVVAANAMAPRTRTGTAGDPTETTAG